MRRTSVPATASGSARKPLRLPCLGLARLDRPPGPFWRNSVQKPGCIAQSTGDTTDAARTAFPQKPSPGDPCLQAPTGIPDFRDADRAGESGSVIRCAFIVSGLLVFLAPAARTWRRCPLSRPFRIRLAGVCYHVTNRGSSGCRYLGRSVIGGVPRMGPESRVTESRIAATKSNSDD